MLFCKVVIETILTKFQTHCIKNNPNLFIDDLLNMVFLKELRNTTRKELYKFITININSVS